MLIISDTRNSRCAMKIEVTLIVYRPAFAEDHIVVLRHPTESYKLSGYFRRLVVADP
jgi:hypothetical protein